MLGAPRGIDHVGTLLLAIPLTARLVVVQQVLGQSLLLNFLVYQVVFRQTEWYRCTFTPPVCMRENAPRPAPLLHQHYDASAPRYHSSA